MLQFLQWVSTVKACKVVMHCPSLKSLNEPNMHPSLKTLCCVGCILLITNCHPIYNKTKLTLVKEPFVKERITFRTDGFYFHVRTTGLNPNGGHHGDSLNKSGIVPIFFYTDGYVHRSNAVFGERAHANKIDQVDSVRMSLMEYEKNLIRWNMVIENKDKNINGWGRYKQYGNDLLIQHYINRGGNYILVEYVGKVVNDKSILLTSKHYPGHPFVMEEKHEHIHELFEFKPLPVKPDSANYIRSNIIKFDRRKRWANNGPQNEW